LLQLFFDKNFASFINDVDVFLTCTDSQIGGVFAPGEDWCFITVELLVKVEDLLAGGHSKVPNLK